MRKLWLIALIFLIQCTSQDKKTETFSRDDQSDTATILYQYWTLVDADNPLGRDVITKEDGKDYMPGIVFIQNGEIVENPAGETRRGKYERFNDSIHVTYDDGSDGSYRIKSINKDSLFVARNDGKELTSILYSATNTWWPDADKNPFTEKNMAWTIRPTAPESKEDIKKRCDAYIRFCQYYLEGYARGGATKISFVGLPNIFNYYTGGLSIPSDKNLNKKWVDCFYNDEQAFEGYTMIRHVILKDYKWDKDEQNWIVQTGPVLAAMRDSLEAMPLK